MAGMRRKPLQGVTNIIRFNWHFYVFSVFFIAVILSLTGFFPPGISQLVSVAVYLAVLSIFISLAVSWYIYDASELYSLNWLVKLNIPDPKRIANINAGFDETSVLLREKYPGAKLDVYDFYNPEKHTEISIKRARKAYTPYPGTVSIDTADTRFEPGKYDIIFLILAVHEIRDNAERVNFFRNLKDSLKPNGCIIIVEHQRDIPNFIAFNIGFLHFHSPGTWLKNFDESGLKPEAIIKFTSFLNIYKLTGS